MGSETRQPATQHGETEKHEKRMRTHVAALFLLVAGSDAGPQTPFGSSDSADLAAIRQTALDYIEGWYTGDAERMERALHPELAKRIVTTAISSGRSVLDQMSAMTLIEGTRAGGGRSIPEGQRAKDVRVLDTFRNAASVRIDAASWVDYLHLARWNGRWVIVNVLWERKDEPSPAPSTSAASTASPNGAAALERELTALYARQADAVMAQDAAALMSFNAPDHQVKLLDGDSVSRAKLEEGLTAFYASGRLVRELSFSFDLLDVAPRGDDVITLVEQKDHRVQLRSDEKPHEIDARVLHRDSWRKTPEGWKRYLTEEVLEVRFTVDGVPITPAEHARAPGEKK